MGDAIPPRYVMHITDPAPCGRRPRALALAAVLALIVSGSAPAGTIRVPYDHPTVQAAIVASNPGDTVLVASGTYTFRDPISFMGKRITVRSERGPMETTLRLFNPRNANRASVVVFDRAEGRGSILEGFTITGGLGTQEEGMIRPCLGGGILCWNSSPTIRYNVMRENKMSEGGHGGGIAIVADEVGGADPLIVHNLICYNTTPRGGGGVYFGQASGTFLENTILGNTSLDDGGGICLEFSYPLIQGNTIVGNVASAFGGGISVFFPAPGPLRPGIVNNTITGNVARDYAGGLSFPPTEADVRNCIIRGNIQPGDQEVVEGGRGGIFVDPTGFPGPFPPGPPEVSYCCLSPGHNCTGTGNTDADPLLTDPGSWEPCDQNPGAPCVWIIDGAGGSRLASWRNGDYELPSGSPCIDGGDPQASPDPDGTRADIGAIYFEIERAFIRGDLDADRVRHMADVLAILHGIFAVAAEIRCQDAADVNDNGHVGLGDAILLLRHIFGVPPAEIPAPRAYPGPDPTLDTLRCNSWAAAEP